MGKLDGFLSIINCEGICHLEKIVGNQDSPRLAVYWNDQGFFPVAIRLLRNRTNVVCYGSKEALLVNRSSFDVSMAR